MKRFTFEKYHGLGNDFVLVDDRAGGWEVQRDAVVAICDRHRGIGADGLILVQSSTKAALRMVIYNADGSRPEMCGNGLRCFARYAREHGMVGEDRFGVETDRGVLGCVIVRDGSGEIEGVEVDMGAPILERSRIPILGEGERFIEELLEVEGRLYTISAVSMGNPHMVIFQKADEADLAIAPKLEGHPSFPQRTNVEFVEERGEGHFGVVVYERGCGFTQACGTGACAVGVAAILTGRAKADQALQVDLPGGTLWITIPADLSTVWMRGAAQRVFCGEWLAV